MMNHSRISIPAVLLSILLFGGCGQDPAGTGYQAVPAGDLIGVKTFDSKLTATGVYTSIFSYPVSHALSSFISLGRGEGYQASLLFRFFGLVDTGAGGGRIVSARLGLSPTNLFIGDPAGLLSFEVKQVRSPWNAGTITADSIPFLQMDAPVKGSFSGTIRDTSRIYLEIDSGMVREWSLAVKNALPIWGMILTPTTNCAALRGFYSSEADSIWLRPNLTVVIERNGKLDTIRADMANIVDTYVINGPPPAAFGPFGVHGALAHRGSIRFDLSSIPQGCIINHAELQLTINRPASKLHYRGYDTLIVEQTLDSLSHTASNVGLFSILKGSNTYSFTGYPLISAVQLWVNRPNLNYGLTLSAGLEASDIDYYAIYGAESDTTRRPRLIVRYTAKP